tara:strand:- start:798 stop:1076 length:279 start_codon:yes stop_codon:yes gene_type:complete
MKIMNAKDYLESLNENDPVFEVVRKSNLSYNQKQLIDFAERYHQSKVNNVVLDAVKTQFCQCVSRIGLNGDRYGKHTCKSCGEEVPNKHRQY